MTIRNNIVHDVPAAGIQTGADAEFAKYEGNIVFNAAWWSSKGTTGLGLNDLNTNSLGVSANDGRAQGVVVQNNLVFACESRIASHVFSKGFSNLSIDEGSALLMQINAGTYNKGYLVEHNFFLYNGKGVGLRSNQITFKNNTLYNNGTNIEVPGGAGLRSQDATNMTLTNNAIETLSGQYAVYFSPPPGYQGASTGSTVSNCSNNVMRGGYSFIGGNNECMDGVAGNSFKTSSIFIDGQGLNFTPVAGQAGASMTTFADLKARMDELAYPIQASGFNYNGLGNYGAHVKEMRKRIVDSIPTPSTKVYKAGSNIVSAPTTLADYDSLTEVAITFPDTTNVTGNTSYRLDLPPIANNITFSVTYAGNGHSSGNVPLDNSNPYLAASNVTVLGEASLLKTGYSFTNWNTAANGSGTAYSVGSTINSLAANTTLYAQWIADAPLTYTVTYVGNGNSNGSAPVDTNSPYSPASNVNILNAPSLLKSGFTFTGWNTAANGSGTAYNVGSSLNGITANIILYAQWTAGILPKYTVTYSGNGNTAGTVPVDPASPYLTANSTSVLGAGSLLKTGSTFTGWNTAAIGIGTAYNEGAKLVINGANVILYAQWSIAATSKGVCGSANTVAVKTAPTSNLCSTGTASAVTGSGPWNWTCAGTTAGSTVSCTAPLSTTPKPTPTHTPQPGSCPNGQKSQGGLCVAVTLVCKAPQVLSNGSCIDPAPLCPITQLLQNKLCVTPAPNATLSNISLNTSFQGDPKGPPTLTNSQITGNIALSHVVIGAGTKIDATVKLGENVVFSSNSLLTPGLDLTQTLAKVGTNNALDLNKDSVIASPSLLEQIRAIPGFADLPVSQTSQGDLQITVKGMVYNTTPIGLTQATTDNPTGAKFLPDGNVQLTTPSRRQILLTASASDPNKLKQSLETSVDLTISRRDSNTGNLIIVPPTNKTPTSKGAQNRTFLFYLARPELASTPATVAIKESVLLTLAAALPNTSIAYHVFMQAGQLRQQALVPMPLDWPALQTSLASLGYTQIKLDASGLIQADKKGLRYQAMANYAVYSGDDPGPLKMTNAGDLNQDGIADSWIIYPNGQSQAIWLLPVSKVPN